MEKLFKLIANRLRSTSPKLFKKISNWAIIIGGIAGVVLILPVSLPAWVITILTLLVGMCAGLTGTSNITTNDKEILEETDKLFEQ